MGASVMDILANYNPSGFALGNQQRQATLEGTQVQTATQQQVTEQERLKNEMAKRDLRDQDIMQRAIVNSPPGDMDAIRGYLIKNGISAPGYLGFQNHLADMRVKVATAKKDEVANQLVAHGQVGNILQSIDQAPDEQRTALIAQALPQLQQIEPDHQWDPAQLLDPNGRKFLLGTHGMTGAILGQAKTQADIDAQKAAAAGHEATAEAARASIPKTNAETAKLTAETEKMNAEKAAMEAMAGDPKMAGNIIDQVLPPDNKNYKGQNAAAKAELEFYARNRNGTGIKSVIDKAQEFRNRIDLALNPEVAANKVNIAVNTEAAKQKIGELSPEALESAAELYRTTGKMSGMARDRASQRQVMNRAAEMGPVDLATNAAAYHANEASLVSLTKNLDSVTAFEKTAGKNLDLFLQQAGKVVDSGVPWINTPLRAVAKNGLGSADQAAYETARQIAINEIAKVTGNPGLAGQLSDSARKEVSEFNPNNATLKQTYRVAQVLKQDMANRRESYEEQKADITRRISTKPAGEAPSTPQPHLIEISGKRYRYNGTGATDDLKNYTEVKGGGR